MSMACQIHHLRSKEWRKLSATASQGRENFVRSSLQLRTPIRSHRLMKSWWKSQEGAETSEYSAAPSSAKSYPGTRIGRGTGRACSDRHHGTASWSSGTPALRCAV